MNKKRVLLYCKLEVLNLEFFGMQTIISFGGNEPLLSDSMVFFKGTPKVAITTDTDLEII